MLTVGDFETPLSIIDRSSWQKISKDTEVWNSNINQLERIDIYGIILAICPVDLKMYVHIKTCLRMLITTLFILFNYIIYIYIYIFNYIIYNCQRLETTKMSFNGCLDKNRLLHANRQWTVKPYKDLDESFIFYEWILNTYC